VRVEDVVDAEQLVGRVAIGSGEDIEPSWDFVGLQFADIHSDVLTDDGP
jgi:hypothetical protein